MTDDRQRLLLIAPPNSYRIAPYVRAAQQLDIPIMVASQGRHSLVSEVASGLHFDPADLPSLLSRVSDEHARAPFCGVVGSDDQTVELASLCARHLSLPHNPPEAARYARRKDLARARLAAAGVAVPAHRTLDLRQELQGQLQGTRYPCVVKPVALSGSRGVIRADDTDALRAACARIAPLLADLEDDFERTQVLVEDYLPGREVALEGMLADGELQVLALFDKPEPLEGPYFEETYYIAPSRLPAATQRHIADCVRDACAAYGLRQGPVHAELRVADGRAWILEVAARTIGGQCAQLLRFGTGLGLEELVLMQAMRREWTAAPAAGAAGVLMIPIPRRGILRRIEGILAAQRVPGIDSIEISVREGYELVPLPEGSSYLGFMFAHGATPAEVEATLRAAHACLRIITAPVLPVKIA